MVFKRCTAILVAGLMIAVMGVLVGRVLSADAVADGWTAPADAAAKKNPIAADAASVAAGKSLYSDNCVMCHGDTGKGDGERGAMVKPAPSDLTSPRVIAESDGALFWKITKGKRPMPGFARSLSDKERWQVVTYIRSLSPSAPTTTSRPAKP